MSETKNPHYQFTAEEYKQKVNSPAASQVYFEHFIHPLVDEAVDRNAATDEPVRILDMACGHAFSMDFVARMPEAEKLEITGIDLSEESLGEAREYFAATHPGLKIDFIQADAENALPVKEGSMDMATAINAMAYKQGHMLKSIFNALKDSGKASVNFFLPDKNQPYMDFYKKFGCEVYERKLEVAANGRTGEFTLLVTDFSKIPHPQAQKIGAQSFFQSKEDIERFARLIGFEVEGCKSYVFHSKPIGDIVHNEVYTLRKPEAAADADVDAGRLTVNERVTDLLDK